MRSTDGSSKAGALSSDYTPKDLSILMPVSLVSKRGILTASIYFQAYNLH